MRVSPFDGSAAEWDAFVRHQPDWTHFHLAGWRDVIAQVFGHACPYLAARDDAGTIVGVLPLVEVRSIVFGSYLVSMPFLNYGGPLGTPAAVEALIEAAERLARDSKVGLLQLRARGALPTTMTAGLQKISVLVDIPEGGPEALWKQLPHKMRTKVRKPQKEGVTVRWGRDQLGPFHTVLAQNMRDLGTPVHSRRFYEVIADTFGESVWFGCAYFNGEVVSGGCGFVWRDEMEITWSSSLRQHVGVRPGYLLHWSFLERAAQEGLRIGNFGRSTPGSGTHEYKQQWGGRDEQLWWYFRSATGATSTPTPQDSNLSWGPRLWRRLPVSVATHLGPMIVRSIP